MSERDNFTLLLTARALKEYTLLLQDAKQQNQRRGNKEAHPRAVLSTNPSALRAANDCTTPVNGAAKTLTAHPQVVSSSRCRVSRQRSSSVDVPPSIGAPDGPEPATPAVNRPGSLDLRRDHSNSSDGSGVGTPLPVHLASPRLSPGATAGRQLVSSYQPTGPTRLQQCFEATSARDEVCMFMLCGAAYTDTALSPLCCGLLCCSIKN
jgi:hypothetical protein